MSKKEKPVPNLTRQETLGSETIELITKRDIDLRIRRHIDKLMTELRFNLELQNPITELSHFHFSQKHINVYFQLNSNFFS